MKIDIPNTYVFNCFLEGKRLHVSECVCGQVVAVAFVQKTLFLRRFSGPPFARPFVRSIRHVIKSALIFAGVKELALFVRASYYGNKCN